MIEYGDPETWGMTVDQFLDASNEQLGTSDIIMDSKYQVKGLNTMPSVQPPMNKVMPSFEGLEDPKQIENYQQIELADGGVVEREGFSEGPDQPLDGRKNRGGSGLAQEFREYLNQLEPKELKNAALQDLITAANENGINITKTNASHVLNEDKYVKIRPRNLQVINTETKSKIDELLDGRIGKLNIVTVDGKKYFKRKRGEIGSSKVGYYRYKPTTQEQREYKRKYENQRRSKLDGNSNRFKSGEKLRDKVWRSFYDSVIDREGNKITNSRFKKKMDHTIYSRHCFYRYKKQ